MSFFVALLVVNPLIVIEKGELSIVISAPHGGRLPVPDCPLRINRSVPQFETVLDTNSDQIALQTARGIERLLGKKPWVIVARFSRKYVDVNRKESDGTECEAGRVVYEQYHVALREAVRSIRHDVDAGLLLDFHSQGAKRDTIFRGTSNLNSVKYSFEKYHSQAISGPLSLLGVMEAGGMIIDPPSERYLDKEARGFNGGWIVQHYGSHNPEGIDAIQLEIGGDYRTPAKMADTMMQIAKAIVSHYKKYLPPSVKQRRTS